MSPASLPSPHIIVVMGVAGSGKTTIGKRLAERLQWPFYDGDDFHPKDNLAKMAQGLPLNDRDRRPWLLALHDLLVGLRAKGGKAVLAASVLKQDYRDLLVSGLDSIRFVYLKGDFSALEKRLKERQGHYFKAGLLQSQFEILEEPEEALTVRADGEPDAIVESIVGGVNP
jgi:gluconokinase